MDKLPLWHERKTSLNEETSIITDEKLGELVNKHHQACLELCSRIERWLNENK